MKTSKRSEVPANKVDMIASVLRNAIIEQALGPGTRLPEDTIGKQFRTSRTIIREALAQLAAEGLVERRHNRSAVVAEPSWDEAQDTFDLRIAVEELVVARIAGSLTGEQKQTLRDHVAKEDAARLDGDEARSLRLAGEFHSLLAELTGSAVLTKYMRELTSRCCLILALYSRPHSSDCAVSEHQEIIELLFEDNSVAAVAANTRHLRSVVERALIKPTNRNVEDISRVLSSYAAK